MQTGQMQSMQPGSGTTVRETAFKTSFMRGMPPGRMAGSSGHITTPGMRTAASSAGPVPRGHGQPVIPPAAQPAVPGPFDLSPSPAPLAASSAAPSDPMAYSGSLQLDPPATLRSSHPRSDSMRSGASAPLAAQPRMATAGGRQSSMPSAVPAAVQAPAPTPAPSSDPLLDFEPTPIDQIGQDHTGEDYSEFSSVLLVGQGQGRPSVRSAPQCQCQNEYRRISVAVLV